MELSLICKLMHLVMDVKRNSISVRNNVIHVVYMFEVYTSHLCSICLLHKSAKLEFYAVIYG